VILCSENQEKEAIDLIATYIWQCSIRHSMDHFTSYVLFNYLPHNKDFNSSIATNIPITTSFFTTKLEDIDINPSPRLEDVQDHLIEKVRRGQFELLGKYHFQKRDASMSHLNYGFKHEQLQTYNNEFLKELNQYNNELLESGELIIPLFMVAPSISW